MELHFFKADEKLCAQVKDYQQSAVLTTNRRVANVEASVRKYHFAPLLKYESLCPLGICMELGFLRIHCLFLVPRSFMLLWTCLVEQVDRKKDTWVKITAQQQVSVCEILPIAQWYELWIAVFKDRYSAWAGQVIKERSTDRWMYGQKKVNFCSGYVWRACGVKD